MTSNSNLGVVDKVYQYELETRASTKLKKLERSSQRKNISTRGVQKRKNQ